MNYYPKVRTIGHREIGDILAGPVVIQEKVDGSNFSFGKTIEGELFAMSRAQRLNFAAPEKMFAPALAHVQAIAHHIASGEAFRCEYLRKPKHNVIAYDRVPWNHLVLFERETQASTGVWSSAGDSRYLLQETAKALWIDVVPELFRGDVSCTKALAELAENWFSATSFLGGSKIEGIVVKNFNRFSEHQGHILVGKLVRQEFKEQHSHVKRANGETPCKLEAIGLRFGGPARWEKAVQFLRESGALKGQPEDIPALLRRVQQDIEEECLDEIKEALWRQFKGAVFKGCRQGLPEWYKSKLLVDVVEKEAAS